MEKEYINYQAIELWTLTYYEQIAEYFHGIYLINIIYK